MYIVLSVSSSVFKYQLRLSHTTIACHNLYGMTSENDRYTVCDIRHRAQ